jgi:tripartite-type tricarboxylate transporter receptor subunit TctC
LGAKDVDVEGHSEGVGADIEARRIDMESAGTHHDHRACHLRIEKAGISQRRAACRALPDIPTLSDYVPGYEASS